jgi:hypothetical protein
VYFVLVEHADEKDKTKMDARLWRPPPSERKTDPKALPKNSPWHADNVMAAFTALQSETGAK